MDRLVTITKKDYNILTKQSEILQALIAYGVNNWDGYSDALDSIDVYGDEDEEDV